MKRTDKAELRAFLPEKVPERWDPRLVSGVILSGDGLLQDDSLPKLREEIHERVRALDMESYGFAHTCTEKLTPWMVFRGIADYADPNRSKNWQLLSTLAAATAARLFLEDWWIRQDPMHDPRF